MPVISFKIKNVRISIAHAPQFTAFFVTISRPKGFPFWLSSAFYATAQRQSVYIDGSVNGLSGSNFQDRVCEVPAIAHIVMVRAGGYSFGKTSLPSKRCFFF